jgi:hypothetical protein
MRGLCFKTAHGDTEVNGVTMAFKKRYAKYRKLFGNIVKPVDKVFFANIIKIWNICSVKKMKRSF